MGSNRDLKSNRSLDPRHDLYPVYGTRSEISEGVWNIMICLNCGKWAWHKLDNGATGFESVNSFESRKGLTNTPFSIHLPAAHQWDVLFTGNDKVMCED